MYSSLHFAVAVLSPGPAFAQGGRAETWLWKALLHLKGSSNKQSNFKPMALAPNELLIIFP